MLLPPSFHCPISPRSSSPGSKQLRKGGGPIDFAHLKTGSPKVGSDIAAVDFGFSLNLSINVGQYQLSAGPRLQSPRSNSSAQSFGSGGGSSAGGGGSTFSQYLSRPNWGSKLKAQILIAAPALGQKGHGDITARALESSTDAGTLSAESSDVVQLAALPTEENIVRQAHPSAQLMDDLLADVSDVASMFGMDSNWMAHMLHP